MILKCEWCGKGPADGVSLFRVNPKGEPGQWRCEADLDRKPDPEVAEIVGVIESGSASRH